MSHHIQTDSLKVIYFCSKVNLCLLNSELCFLHNKDLLPNHRIKNLKYLKLKSIKNQLTLYTKISDTIKIAYNIEDINNTNYKLLYVNNFNNFTNNLNHFINLEFRKDDLGIASFNFIKEINSNKVEEFLAHYTYSESFEKIKNMLGNKTLGFTPVSIYSYREN